MLLSVFHALPPAEQRQFLVAVSPGVSPMTAPATAASQPAAGQAVEAEPAPSTELSSGTGFRPLGGPMGTPPRQHQPPLPQHAEREQGWEVEPVQELPPQHDGQPVEQQDEEEHAQPPPQLPQPQHQPQPQPPHQAVVDLCGSEESSGSESAGSSPCGLDPPPLASLAAARAGGGHRLRVDIKAAAWGVGQLDADGSVSGQRFSLRFTSLRISTAFTVCSALKMPPISRKSTGRRRSCRG